MESIAKMKSFIHLVFFSGFLFCNVPFRIGETLYYNASFGGIPAASGILKVVDKEKINDKTTFHVQFTAKSQGLANYIFPIDDEINIWLTEDSLKTIKAISKINEGNYKAKRNVIIDHNKQIAIVNNDSIKIKSDTHSPYSLFYYYRNKDFTKVKKDGINTIQGKKLTKLNIKIENNITVTVPAGEFMTTKLTPQKSNNQKFKNNGTMSIFFSNDKNRYPVLIWLKLKYGKLELELEKITN